MIAGEGGSKVGRIYLPSSFTGGPRNMAMKYQDAMAVVNRRGKPSFFVTQTCNPKNLLPHQTASDRPDLVDRVFHEKLAITLRKIKDGSLFGKMVTLLHVIEFQKRGLPHAHIALRVAGGGPMHPDDIDQFVRATIPDEHEAGGRLRRLVIEHMIHGPCGQGYPSYPCTDNEKRECTKGYPKAFLTKPTLMKGDMSTTKDQKDRQHEQVTESTRLTIEMLSLTALLYFCCSSVTVT